MSSLQLVDFVDAENQPIDGLVSVSRPSLTKSPHERAILLQAATFEHIDYVYFRRFKDAEGKGVRSSQVAAYVIDNSKQRLTEDDLAKLHHQLWLHGVAPLVYVAWPTRVDILSCARKPDFWDDSAEERKDLYRHAERIEAPITDSALRVTGKRALKTAAEIAEAFSKQRRRLSAYRLAEGTFWDDPDNQKLAKNDAAAHRRLIQAIVEADQELNGAKYKVRRRLLVLMVLIKYLEDRGVFRKQNPFGRFESVRGLLQRGSPDDVLKILKRFEDKFNGDVFSLGDQADDLTDAELKRFAKLVEAKTIGKQKHFWELFSFEHIPVEVISRLYQRFVTGHGAVYTPPFLASLLLDQVMPYDHMNGEEKVLDPTCGSGIFLVGAFKRLVIHWRSRHHWKKPTAENLKRILSRSIHGVELETGAVDLTAFSLALAVCDALHPDAIWKELKFEKLRGRNLREGDFFAPETFANSDGHEWPGKFDVVIGNPPFQSKLTDAAKVVDKSRPKDQPKLPDRQAAYLFLERGLMSLAPNGKLCLLQPHGLLYNSKPTAFRQYLMTLSRLHTVLDFVSIRRMFEGKNNKGADAKPIAWLALQEPPNQQPINHVTFRRTYSVSQRIGFEIDHYDWHRISPQQVQSNPVIWRASLLGGGRLCAMSDRLRLLTSLKVAVAAKKWVYFEGFNVGSNGQPCKYLTGEPYLPTEALTVNGIDESRITKLTVKRFELPRVEELYKPPLLLIKENSSLPVAFWNQSNLTFRHSIVGIHAPKEDERKLQDMFRAIQKHRLLYRFCYFLIGARALTGRATAINKQDIDQLPMPDDPAELDLSFWEEALKEDVLNHMADYVRLGQDSDLLKKSAELGDVTTYSSLFVRMLGSLYRDLKAHEPVFLNGLTAQPFYFGERPDVSWLGQGCEDSLHRLIYDESGESLRTVRVVRYYEGNVILIVKPDRLRYWIPSTAIRDADDTLIDLRRHGW